MRPEHLPLQGTLRRHVQMGAPELWHRIVAGYPLSNTCKTPKEEPFIGQYRCEPDEPTLALIANVRPKLSRFIHLCQTPHLIFARNAATVPRRAPIREPRQSQPCRASFAPREVGWAGGRIRATASGRSPRHKLASTTLRKKAGPSSHLTPLSFPTRLDLSG